MRVFDCASGDGMFVAGTAAILALLSLAFGCATSGLGDKGFRHPEQGYRVPHPPAVDGAAWRVVSVDDAHVGYRSTSDAFMALDSRCEEKEVDPAVLGRQLLVGIANRERIESEVFDFAGGRAYAQLVEAEEEGGARVRTRTVTLLRDGCVIDWMLVVAPGHPEVEASFEAWWRGFVPRGGRSSAPSDASAPQDSLAEMTP